MQPYVKAQGTGNIDAMQYLNPQTAWGLTVRDSILRIVGALRLDSIVPAVAAKLGLGGDEKLDMPEYAWPAA